MGWLLLSAGVTVLLWHLPWGNYVLYPFTILATWFHEMGHGLTALALGGSFHQLLIWPNGSGLAQTSLGAHSGRVAAALTAAGGPLGPVICGALFILSGQNPRTSRLTLLLLGLVMIFSVLFWVRTLFGLVAILAWGMAVLVTALKAPDWVKEFSIQFLGAQACISAYQTIDYLFTKSVRINGQPMMTDTAGMQAALLLPYWFWALTIIAASAGLLFLALRAAGRTRA
ncbi:MAG: M50 family metallopeptidase [Lentisphaerota bacterium]